MNKDKRRTYGIVKCFGSIKEHGNTLNYGLIYGAEDGIDFYLNESEIKSENISAGDFVFFDTTRTDKNIKGRFVAYNIILLEDNTELVSKANKDLKVFESILSTLLTLKNDIKKNGCYISFNVRKVVDCIDEDIKIQSESYRSFLNTRELFKSYIKLYKMGYTKFKEQIHSLAINKLKYEKNYSYDYLPIDVYTQRFINDISNTKDGLYYLKDAYLDNKDSTKLKKLSLLEKSIKKLFTDKINSGNFFREDLNSRYNFIRPLLKLKCKNYIDVCSKDVQIKYYYEEYLNAKDKSQHINSLAKLYDETDIIEDINTLPVELCSKKILDKITPSKKVEYIQKVIPYLTGKYEQDKDNSQTKKDLQYIYLYKWKNLLQDKSNSQAKKNIQYAILNDWRNFFCADSIQEEINRNILYFSDKNFTEQIMSNVFQYLNEEVQIAILCLLAKQNNMSSFKDVIDVIDRESSTYIAVEILKSREIPYKEKGAQLIHILELIYQKISLMNKKIQKDEINRFSLDGILHKCELLDKDKTENYLYCEGQEWKYRVRQWIYAYGTKQLSERWQIGAYCPLLRENSNKCYHKDRCNAVYPNYEETKPEEWRLGEMLQYAGLLDKDIAQSVLNKNANFRNIVGKIGGHLNHCNNMLSHMRCRECNNIMEADLKYSKIKLADFCKIAIEDRLWVKLNVYGGIKPYARSAATVFHCKHKEGKHDHNVYLNVCNGRGCDHIIDSRECHYRVLGYYLCMNCGNGGSDRFIAGSICPNCGSYRMKTSRYRNTTNNDPRVSKYKCLDCEHEIKVDPKTAIFCPSCYEEYSRDRTFPVDNITSNDGINFKCNRCGTTFRKEVPIEPVISIKNDGTVDLRPPCFKICIKKYKKANTEYYPFGFLNNNIIFRR